MLVGARHGVKWRPRQTVADPAQGARNGGRQSADQGEEREGENTQGRAEPEEELFRSKLFLLDG